jgi:hypothetical protein
MVALTAGSLGSAGALLEVAAVNGGASCRSLWRYREGTLTRAPVLGASGPLPDCGPTEWEYRWERPAEDAPALYTRERSLHTAAGLLREVESFRYAGFRLETDLGRSRSWINGVEIPRWRDTVLYPRPLLDQLALRFDYSSFRTEPRLRLSTDRARGIFELRIEEGPRRRELPITASVPVEGRRGLRLTAGKDARVLVEVSEDGSVPVEAEVQGVGAGLDRVYAPVTRPSGSGLRVYDSAEQEVGEELLLGTWDDGREQFDVAVVWPSPARLRYRQSEVSLSISGAPPGADALLVPRDGSAPSAGILLRGADSFAEVPVRCAPAREPGAWRCETAGPGRPVRRAGARLNLR